MRHRHLDVPADLYTVATIASILERGGASDVWRLIERIEADPNGSEAAAAAEAARHTNVYGFRRLIPAIIARARDERQR